MKPLFLALTLLLTFTLATAQTKPSKYGPVTEGYFRGADGVRLFYRKVGKGKSTVVFLHGGPGLGIGDGGYDMEPLARGRVLLMFDQRGSGRSAIVTDPKLLTVEYQVRDLEAFRKHFKLERMTLIGLSWGTGLAILYTNAHPDHVERLLLVSPMPPAKTPYWEQRTAKINSLIGATNAARLSEIRQLLPKSSDTEAVALCREAFTISSEPYFLDFSSVSGSPGRSPRVSKGSDCIDDRALPHGRASASFGRQTGIRTESANDRLNQPQMNRDTTDLNNSRGSTNTEPGAVSDRVLVSTACCGNDRVNQPQMNADTTDLNKSSGTTNTEPGAVSDRVRRERRTTPSKRSIRAQPKLAHQRTQLIRERVDLMCDSPPAALRNRFVVVFAVFDSLGDWDFRPLLARIKAPALVVEGEKTNVPLDATRQWAAALPNGRLLLIPNADHVHFIEQPTAFFKAADQFLRGRHSPLGKIPNRWEIKKLREIADVNASSNQARQWAQ